MKKWVFVLVIIVNVFSLSAQQPCVTTYPKQKQQVLDSLNLLASQAILLPNKTNANNLYTQLIKLDSTNCYNYYNRSKTYNPTTDFYKIIEDLSIAISLNPKFVVALRDRAILLKPTNLNSAINDYAKVVELDTSNARYYYEYASLLLKDGQNPKAFNYFDESERKGLQLDSLFYFKGICYYQLGEVGKAQLYYDKALKLNPNNVDALLSKALLLFRQSKTNADIVTLLNKVIKLNPMYGIAYYYRAECYNATGNSKQACNDYDMAIKLGAVKAGEKPKNICK